MRKLVTYLSAILVLSCSAEKEIKEKEQSVVHLEGVFEEGEGMLMKLSRIENETRIVIDSFILETGGAFSLDFQISKTGFYSLSNGSGNSISLVCSPGDSLEIQADYYNFREYELQGSPDVENIMILNNKTREFLDEISMYSKIVQDSVNSPSYARLRLEIDRKYRASFDSLKAFSESMIRKNPNSLVSLLALSNQLGRDFFVFHPVKDLPVFLFLDSSLMKIYPDEPAVRSLHSQTERIKNTGLVKNEDKLLPGSAAPELTMPDPDGKNIRLDNLKGKTVLVCFTATWCERCKSLDNIYKELAVKYSDSGFVVFQVSLDQKKESWKETIGEPATGFIYVNDLLFWESAAVKAFSVDRLPYSCLVNSSGKIIIVNPETEELKTELNLIFEKK